MTHYVGLDVSQKVTAICAVEDTGRRVWRGQCASDPEQIERVVRRHAGEDARIGIETGPMTPWLVHELRGRGLEVTCLDARHARAALKMQINKTDQNDAEGLTQIMRTGWYRSVHVKSFDSHRARALLGARVQLVGMTTRLSNHIRGVLDWTVMEIDSRGAEDILALLEGPRPVVPHRVYHPADIGMWDGSLRPPGLGGVLRTVSLNDPRSLRALTAALSGSARLPTGQTVFAVGTDGDVPAGLDRATHQLFLDVIDRLASRLLRDVSRRVSQPDNQILRCLTWINGLCPDALKSELLQALRCMDTGDFHPLLAPRAARRVVLHGIGRVTTKPAALRRLITLLCGRLDRVDCLGAFSSLLSRPPETPRVLIELDIASMAQSLVQVLRDLHNTDNYGVILKYVLLSVGGLLRVREHEPWALVGGRSPQADTLIAVLSETVARIKAHPSVVPAANAKLNSALELVDLLSGTGGRPDMLTIMDEMPDN